MLPRLKARLRCALCCGSCKNAPGCCATICRLLQPFASPCELRELWPTCMSCSPRLQAWWRRQCELMHCCLACRCVDALNALKHEALLWRERALQVVRQNSLFMRQQLLRSEVCGPVSSSGLVLAVSHWCGMQV